MKWISVEDRLPEEGSGRNRPVGTGPYSDDVLVYESKYKTCEVATYSFHSEEWIDDWGEKVRDATHWMPLPDPPKQEKG